MRRIK